MSNFQKLDSYKQREKFLLTDEAEDEPQLPPNEAPDGVNPLTPAAYQTPSIVSFKGTRGGKSRRPEVVGVILNYCGTC